MPEWRITWNIRFIRLRHGSVGDMVNQKTFIFFTVFMLVIGIVGTIWGTQIAEAASGTWNSCPRGEINCRYPAKCHSYIDTNKDRICDRSQANPQSAITPVPAATQAVNAASTTTGTLAVAVTPAATAASIEKSDSTADSVPAVAVPDDSSNTPPGSSREEPVTSPAAAESGYSYYFVPILLVTAILYALTWFMSARKVIKTLLHRKIWNVVLLVTMLVSSVLGLFLILSIDFNINITLPFNLLFWHVEAGIALGIVGIFHIGWHWRYFAKMLRTPAPAGVEAKKELRPKATAPGTPPVIVKDSADH